MNRGSRFGLALGLGLALCASPVRANISGTVWLDTNCNGILEGGENGMAGVTVVVSYYSPSTGGCTGTPAVTAVTTTDSNGQFLVACLPGLPCPNYMPDGYYKICFVVPAGYAVSPQPASGSGIMTTVGPDGCSVCFYNENGAEIVENAGLCANISGPGTGTPGFWKNHPDAWPANQVVIGGIIYTEAQAINLMNQSVTKDKWLTMFDQLVSAKLNVIAGNPSGCIDSTIADADAWMVLATPLRPIAGSSALWQLGSPLATQLDAYNNGLLCAPHRN
jgi:SdrD B-like domain